ncbi:MAG: zinc metalloprotease [Bacteroidota bacterium]
MLYSKKLSLFFVIISPLFFCPLFAQFRQCETQVLIVESTNIKTDSSAYSKAYKSTPYFIPVAFHVIYNDPGQNISNDMILDQLRILNSSFSSLDPTVIQKWPQATTVPIQFCLAKIRAEYEITPAIFRVYTPKRIFTDRQQMKFTVQGGSDAFYPEKILNIWICNLGNNRMGFAQMPGGLPNIDGIVINYKYVGKNERSTHPFNLGKTCVHEVGHWLGLKHIWGDGPCYVDDGIEDTPIAGNPNYGCPISANSCQKEVMTQNYMDYVHDACMSFFTKGQSEKMITTLEDNNLRSSFVNTSNCIFPSDREMDLQSSPLSSLILSKGGSIKFSEELIGMELHLFNSIGQLVNELSIQSRFQTMPQLAKGIYFILLVDGKNGYRYYNRLLVP